MAYQALYRKWRPQTFTEVAGQDAVSGTLKNQIESGRVGHAYLFCGTRGCGKTSLAKIMARAVNCENAQKNGGNPCNACPSCLSILNGNSMNVFEIDAASNNGVDNIRDIRDQVEYPPTEGKYKVYIIDEVHMLSPGAFNALLKTLEEPPSYVIFILATTDPQKVPQTILSRCQRYDFRRMSKATIIDYINKIRSAEGFSAEDKAVAYVAEAADGSMRDGLSILDQCLAFAKGETLTYEKVLEVLGASDMSVFSDLYRALCRKDATTALSLLSGQIAAGKEPGLFINDFIWYLRNVLLCDATRGGAEILEVTEDTLSRLREDVTLLPRTELISMISSMAELSNRARFSTQKRVLLEVELIRLAADVAKPADIRPQITEAAGVSRNTQATDTVPWNEPAAVPVADTTMPAAPQAAPQAPDVSAAMPAADEGNSVQSPRREPHIVRRAPETPPAAEPAQDSVTAPSVPAAPAPAEAPKTHIGSKLEIIRENWDMLISELSPANKVLFQGTVLKEERGGILIVFKNKINFTLASKNQENGLVKLSNTALKKLGVNVAFMARVALRDEFNEEKPVITDEDIKKINFPVDIEG
ncbi:MAG: DNA polymerase III subunit gamma/tau [Lachnospiraceae bacterium]|nr:DNA polymerase III subunit gamma/tau [Lachnospiraceae bacterium]